MNSMLDQHISCMILMFYNPTLIHQQYPIEHSLQFSVNSFVKSLITFSFTQDELDLLFRLIFRSSFFNCENDLSNLPKQFSHSLFHCILESYVNLTQRTYQTLLKNPNSIPYQNNIVILRILVSLSHVLPQLLFLFIQYVPLNISDFFYFEIQFPLIDKELYQSFLSLSYLPSFLGTIYDYIQYISKKPATSYILSNAVVQSVSKQLTLFITLFFDVISHLYQYDESFIHYLLLWFLSLFNETQKHSATFGEFQSLHITLLLSMIVNQLLYSKSCHASDQFAFFFSQLFNDDHTEFFHYQYSHLSPQSLAYDYSQLQYYFENYLYLNQQTIQWDSIKQKQYDDFPLSLPSQPAFYTSIRKPYWLINSINQNYSSILYKTDRFCSHCKKPLYMHYYLCVHCSHYYLCPCCYQNENRMVLQYYIESILNKTESSNRKNKEDTNPQHDPYSHFFIHILIPYIKYKCPFPIGSFPVIQEDRLQYCVNHNQLKKHHTLSLLQVLTDKGKTNRFVNINIAEMVLNSWLSKKKEEHPTEDCSVSIEGGTDSTNLIGFINPSTRCSVCSVSPIIGLYYICFNCPLVLCSKCYISEVKKHPCYCGHNLSHIMIIISHPIQFEEFNEQRQRLFHSQEEQTEEKSSLSLSSIFPKHYFSSSTNEKKKLVFQFLFLFYKSYHYSYARLYSTIRRYSSLTQINSIFQYYMIHIQLYNEQHQFIDFFSYLSEILLILFDIRVGDIPSANSEEECTAQSSILSPFTFLLYSLQSMSLRSIKKKPITPIHDQRSIINIPLSELSAFYNYEEMMNEYEILQKKNHQSKINQHIPILFTFFNQEYLESICIAFQYHLYSLSDYQHFITNLHTEMKRQYTSILLLVSLFLYHPTIVSFPLYCHCFDILLHLLTLYFEDRAHSTVPIDQLNCFQYTCEILFNGYLYITSKMEEYPSFSYLQKDLFYILCCYYQRYDVSLFFAY